MKPLFPVESGQVNVPLFAYGQLLLGQPLAWVLAGSTPVEAQLRGQLWRLPSGAVLLSLDPQGTWITGELYARPSPDALRLLPSLLGADGLSPAFERARARVGPRAEVVQAWSAPAERLSRAGAHPLRGGNWRRIAPR